MFIDNLKAVKVDLSKHKRSKSTLLAYYINKRLNKSLSTYYKEMNQSLSYLKAKDNMRMARRLNKGDEYDKTC